MNILLNITYDGTNYSGWQRQQNAMTIQEKLEDALYSVLQEKITVDGASRTDAGVHALGQKATFQTNRLMLPLERLPMVLNHYLPEDIVVTDARPVAEGFHARKSAVKKTYQYKIDNNSFPIPTLRNHTWHVRKPLDMQSMRQACPYFMGTHDFTSFCSAKTTVKTRTRTILDLHIQKEEQLILFEVTGNGFLYNMVRIMIGTLVDVGLGKLPPEAISDIIKAQDRKQARKTAEPEGLLLLEVYF